MRETKTHVGKGLPGHTSKTELSLMRFNDTLIFPSVLYPKAQDRDVLLVLSYNNS